MSRSAGDGLAKRNLRAILDAAVDAIVSIDGRGLIRSVNPATERMFGYGAGEMIGKNVSMLMTPEHRRKHDGYVARYRRTGEKRVIGVGRETEGRRKDGTVFAVDLAVSEVEKGELFTGIIRDVSDRKRAEARLREADRMASIGTLAAGLGHDMNNVLLPVRARLSALWAEGRQGRLTASAREDVSEISRSIDYLQQLADGLHYLVMDPDSNGRGETELEAWWAQTGALLSRAVPKRVSVTSSFAKGLPRVTVSAHSLTQAVLNLMVNAGEAIETGGRRRGVVCVGAEIAGDGSRVVLSVRDNGRGMSQEVRRRAFDMFFTTKTRGLGTGLGLALVRRVAEQAGGSVAIESTPGKGTTVAITLPAVVERARPRAGAVISVRDGRRAAMVRHVLEGAGVEVAVGGDAAGAGLWVVDGATSVRAVREWRKRWPKGRVVLLGRPGRGGSGVWDSLGAVMIEDENDLGAIRAALGRASAGL